MRLDGPVREILRRSRVARIATVSRNGRPSVNPLWFVEHGGHVWLGTADWTLAARNVGADPRVSVLFEIEAEPGDTRVVRITGRAEVRTDRKAMLPFFLRSVPRYLAAPGEIRSYLAHVRQLGLRRRYYAQSAHRGRACVIDVTPETAEIL